MITVTFWPILAAGVASVIIGMAWFNPKVFGNAWMRLGNVHADQSTAAKKRMLVSSLIALLASMAAAYVMNYFGIAWGVYDWLTAVQLGFWCWLGFAAPPLLGSVLWERKSIKYFLIVAGFWLVSFISMALVLTFFAGAGS